MSKGLEALRRIDKHLPRHEETQEKEFSEFYHYTTKRDNVKGIIHDYEELTRAPQSWCYIEP